MKVRTKQNKKTQKFNNVTATVVRLLAGQGGSSMTANQVAYWQLQEAKRHNVMDESVRLKEADTRAQRVKTQNRLDTMNYATDTAFKAVNSVGNILGKIFL